MIEQPALRLFFEGVIALTVLIGGGVLIYVKAVSFSEMAVLWAGVLGYWFARTSGASASEHMTRGIDKAMGNSVNVRSITNSPTVRDPHAKTRSTDRS